MVSNEESIEKTEYIKGELLYTIFHNENEHFSIAKIKILDTNEDYQEKDIVAKGYFTNLQEETAYSFYGQFEKHPKFGMRSEEHTSELQSRGHLVCRLLLEKKNKQK